MTDTNCHANALPTVPSRVERTVENLPWEGGWERLDCTANQRKEEEGRTTRSMTKHAHYVHQIITHNLFHKLRNNY